MNRAAIISIAGLGLVGLAAGLSSWRVSPEWIRTLVAGPLGRAGFEVTAVGEGRLRLLPLPRIAVGAIRVRERGGGTEIDAPQLRGTLRLQGPAPGVIGLAGLTLVNPAIVLAQGHYNAALRHAAGLADAAVSPEAGPRDIQFPEIGRIAILDGTVSTRSSDASPVPLLSGLNALVDQPGAGLFDVSGSAVWRGETVKLTATGLPLRRRAELEAVPVEIVVTSALLDARLTGEATVGPHTQTDGTLVLKSTAADRLADWLGIAPPLPLSGPLEVAGAVRIQPGRVALSEARVVLPAGRFDGVLALRESGDRLSLDGTLDTSTLDLTASLAPLFPSAGPDGWSREPFDGRLLPRGDLDLRISADRLVAGPLILENAAITLMGRNGRTDAVLSSADAFKGALKARLTVGSGPRGFDVKLTANAEKVEAAAALAALADVRRLSGIASGALQLEGSGDSPADLMRSLDGRFSATLRQGELVGLNVPDVLKTLERRPLVAAVDVKGGRTPIESAAITARISKGVADLAESMLVSPTSRVMLSGRVGLADRSVSLSGIALPLESTGMQESIGLPFEVTGSFDDLRFMPDVKDLIRRSGAAAPFFQGRPPVAPADAAKEPAPLGQPQP